MDHGPLEWGLSFSFLQVTLRSCNSLTTLITVWVMITKVLWPIQVTNSCFSPMGHLPPPSALS